MTQRDEIRRNEVAVDAPEPSDARLTFIGTIRTPWTARGDTPRQGRHDGPLCTIEVFEPWVAALAGIEKFERLEILYWLHEARRDLVLQSPADSGRVLGTFAIRSPVRPNPIGTSIVLLDKVDGNRLFVRGLDCLDGTPLLDLKPDRTLFKPMPPTEAGEAATAPKHHCEKA